MMPEPFVSAEQAAHFLSINRRYLLALARKGIAGAYAVGTGTIRRIWVFRLTELASAIADQDHLTQKKRNALPSGQATSTLERGLYELSAWVTKNNAPQARRHLGVALPCQS